MSLNGSAFHPPGDQQLAVALRAIASTYPRWMDETDSVGVAQFRGLVKRASLVSSQRPMHDFGVSGERWRRQARSVIERMEALERRVSAGLPAEVDA